MRPIRPIVLIFLLMILGLSSCSTYRSVQNSGVLNTMAIELSDENVSYQRLESKFARETFAGFLPNASSKNVVEATVISNNNGTTNSTLTASFGANFLAALTLLGTSAGIYVGLHDPNEEFNPAIGGLSMLVGLALNEQYWRPFNQNRMQGEALQSAMNQNPDADFYSFPYAEFEVKPGLFGTRWSGTQRIVAANISDEVIPKISSKRRQRSSDVPVPINSGANESIAPATPSGDEKSIEESPDSVTIDSPEIEGTWPTINGKTVKIGSTGTYQTSKKKTSKVRVVNILNFDGSNQEFQIAIVIGNAYQRIINSTDPKFVLD